MNKKIVLIFSLVCLFAICINIVTTCIFVSDLFNSMGERRQALDEIYQYQGFLSSLKDAETSERGFVITGDPRYLQPYHDALSYFDSEKTKKFLNRELKNRDREIAQEVMQINRIKDSRLNELAMVIESRKEKGFQAAADVIVDHTEKRMMDEMRGLIGNILERNQKKIDLLDEHIKQAMRRTMELLIVSNLLAIILLGLCLVSIYRSIEKLGRKEKELYFTLEKLNENLAYKEAILNSTDYAIISGSPEGIITSFNPAAERMLGYRMEELIGRHTPSIFHDANEMEERAIVLSKLLNRKVMPGCDVFILLAKTGMADCNEWTYIRKDGSRFPVSLCVTAVKNPQGEIIGYVGIAYDITERRAMNRMKNELIAITSHELRSPVIAIKGTFDLLSQQEFPFSDSIEKVIALGQKNCNRLVQLTNDILDVQNIETGKIPLDLKKINVAEFLSEILVNEAVLASQEKISLIGPTETIPVEWFVEADELRLIQVMHNLLSRAINYSPKQGIVEIGVRKLDQKIRFEIKDQGPEITSEFRSRVFEKFERDTSSVNAQKKGTGMELNLAKTIIEKHNGRIDFATGSQGSTFWFELNLFLIN